MKYERSKQYDSIAKPTPFNSAAIKRMLHPETKFLLDSRLIRMEWLVDEPTDPWLELRVYRLRHVSVFFQIGRFHIRYSPWSKEDWAEAKREGATGARNRNARKAKFT